LFLSELIPQFSQLKIQKDPIDSNTDTEHAQGHILNAMLSFPATYTFHVVGKTAGDGDLQSIFVQQVKDVMRDDTVVFTITPRGRKFTKVSIHKVVVNSEEISSIYEQLSKLELSVMQF
jgi:putative lipoic acid-binding regulatory protein